MGKCKGQTRLLGRKVTGKNVTQIHFVQSSETEIKSQFYLCYLSVCFCGSHIFETFPSFSKQFQALYSGFAIIMYISECWYYHPNVITFDLRFFQSNLFLKYHCTTTNISPHTCYGQSERLTSVLLSQTIFAGDLQHPRLQRDGLRNPVFPQPALCTREQPRWDIQFDTKC